MTLTRRVTSSAFSMGFDGFVVDTVESCLLDKGLLLDSAPMAHDDHLHVRVWWAGDVECPEVPHLYYRQSAGGLQVAQHQLSQLPTVLLFSGEDVDAEVELHPLLALVLEVACQHVSNEVVATEPVEVGDAVVQRSAIRIWPPGTENECLIEDWTKVPAVYLAFIFGTLRVSILAWMKLWVCSAFFYNF